ncbi:helix-turn-helix domain-containing protein [Pseudomonas syringae]|uniref:LexA family transcriptional regulator n=1 Tax=Pseudomonas syringae TaxID=317 RepID=UPI0018E607AD|nr:LexA family transcriptional regulator [Pseudomonas syringae]MBI6849071.1 helix-turn-helix domain-containing protein [Pseudomonas syringae]
MNKESRRLPLASWQIEDSDRLKSLYQERRAARKLTQEKMAEALGDGVTQGAISHFMNRRTALNLRSAVVFARLLGVQVSKISPTLSGELKKLGLLDDDGNVKGDEQPVPASMADTPLLAGDEPEVDLDSSYSFIPQYTAMAAAGAGHDNPHVEIRSTLAFKKEWLATKGLQPKNLRVIYADGESMWPTINDQDVLLVDSSQVEPIDNGVFVIESGIDGTVVKRLVRAPLQQWILRSDNTDKAAHPDRFYLSSESNEHQIIGRVIWRGGDL